MKTKQETVRLIAEMLVNQRVMRRGAPPFANPLDMLPAHLKTEVMEDAEAVYNAISDSRDSYDD